MKESSEDSSDEEEEASEVEYEEAEEKEDAVQESDENTDNLGSNKDNSDAKLQEQELVEVTDSRKQHSDPDLSTYQDTNVSSQKRNGACDLKGRLSFYLYFNCISYCFCKF